MSSCSNILVLLSSVNKSGGKLKFPLETSFDQNFRHFCELADSEIYLLQSISLFPKLSLAVVRMMHFLFVHTVINLEQQILRLVYSENWAKIFEVFE